ncbi:hypothetical protein [Leeuwenhoekiella sp. NPDC079379]|uniref:hypothetical protein n=1 Tax=Leeuwenhoekiella sp. NPDC079379 TaxID=3364122 RepID=UPI0037C6B5EF
MNIISILIISGISTLAMTAFSYLLTLLVKKNLIEPYWLNVVLFQSKTTFRPLGWILHYMTGIGFLYLQLFILKFLPENSLANGLLIGIIEGILGIFMWHTLFKILFKPDELKLSWYYLNLLGVHIVFCYTALYCINYLL